ncbi:MAG TPA: hypothetical protein VGM81_21365 [Burkholderiaceae bacterium]|jgi:hypothetical protein
MNVRHTLIAATLSLVAGAAAAQGSDLTRVEIAGKQLPKLSRTDVHKICTHLDSTLSEGLANAWFHNQAEGDVRVQFQLQGNEITNVTTTGGPRVYHQAIRHAMPYVDCQTDASASQQFAFVVAFRASEENPGQMKMAFLERQ